MLSRAKGGLKRAVLQVLVLEIILWVEGSRSSDKAYAGKVAMFGEVVLGFLKPDRKAIARWEPGIWLWQNLGKRCSHYRSGC